MIEENEKAIEAISPLLAFLTAVQFLTRVPLPSAMSCSRDQYPSALRASVVYFPIVGVFIGVSTTITYCISSYFWSPLIAATLAVAAEALITGAFHEDALADATDALGGGWTREQVLEILKDSRHGTFGVLALVIGVLLRIALIANLSWPMAWLAIPFSAGIGRWSILLLMSRLEPITDRPTMARDVGTKPSARTILLGALGPIVAFGIASCLKCDFESGATLAHAFKNTGVGFFLAILVSLLMTWYYARLVHRRVGGVTGDFLGANCYLVQLASLLAMQPN
ncbi:MAG TPA: adenosylcobinamide-GDP ribazoletransferase [Pirellula sp.]|nr:adenosylcobinamide-GDP ribazoletransferase [Pirellula sp.]